MRKYLFILLLVSANTAFCQIEKGTKIIGTSIGNLNYDVDNDIFSMTINPFVAKFVSDRVAIGASASIGLVFMDGPNISLGLQPMVRLYNKAVSPDRFFAQGGCRRISRHNGRGILFLRIPVVLDTIGL